MSSDHFAPEDQPMAAAAPEPTGPMGFARLFSVIASPTTTFKAVAQKPQPWVGLVAFMVLVALGAAISAHITGPEQMEAALDGPFGSSLAENEEYFDEIEAARTPSIGERVKNSLIGSAVAAIIVAIAALIYWGVCAILGGKAGFKKTLDMIFLASWIGSIGQLLTNLLIVAKGTSIGVGLSLALLVPNLDPKSSAFIALNTFTNFFAIWQLVILATGFSLVHELSKAKGWMASVIPWLILSIIMVGLQVAFT